MVFGGGLCGIESMVFLIFLRSKKYLVHHILKCDIFERIGRWDNNHGKDEGDVLGASNLQEKTPVESEELKMREKGADME